MAISELKGKVVPIKLWTNVTDLEEAAQQQLINTASVPQVVMHVAAMPDVHMGKGATIGSVIATKGAVIPAAIGVDIGCGMAAVQTNLSVDDISTNMKKLDRLRTAIEAAIPVGFNSHEKPAWKDRGWESISERVSLDGAMQELMGRYEKLTAKGKGKEEVELQVGTLGSGNHFIELSKDEAGKIWLMLHSGSRNIGNAIADFHFKRAKDLPVNKDAINADLSILVEGTEEMQSFMYDALWAQDYAWMNRTVMLYLFMDVLAQFYPSVKFPRKISCHHNYIAPETHFGQQVWVTRKGAIRAAEGDLGIIPGSMGTPSYITQGLGNPDSFCSAAHGAGRRMSRTAARKKFTLEDLEKQTDGISCRKDKGVLDEIPRAYKDIEEVMENQKDLVRPMFKLFQLISIKG